VRPGLGSRCLGVTSTETELWTATGSQRFLIMHIVISAAATPQSTGLSIRLRAGRAGKCVLVVALGTTAACGNAIDSISVGEWQQVGVAAPPIVPPGEEVTTRQLAGGDGTVVQAGDLVKVRVTVLTPPANDRVLPREFEPRVGWVWTGRDDVDSWEYGQPGAASVRATLIGRQPGERFEITRSSAATATTRIRIPEHGLIGPSLSAHRLTLTNYHHQGLYYWARRWPPIELEPQGYRPARAEIEVLAVCRDAQAVASHCGAASVGFLSALGGAAHAGVAQRHTPLGCYRGDLSGARW
jgi:hypothetical protein